MLSLFGNEKITIYVTGESPADVDLVNFIFFALPVALGSFHTFPGLD